MLFVKLLLDAGIQEHLHQTEDQETIKYKNWDAA